jgi:hypothetical protein
VEKMCSERRNKGGNETPSARKAAPRKPSRATLRLKTVVALGRLHTSAETPAPLTPLPQADNLTALYEALSRTVMSPEACAVAGVAVGSTWSQALVVSHMKAALTGDNPSINSIVTRLEGKVPTAAMGEEQFLAYLETVVASPDAARVRQLVLNKLGAAPALHVHFVDTPTPEGNV